MKPYFFALIIITLFFSCGTSEEEQKKREHEIADSVAKMLTGKSLSDSANIKRIEKQKDNFSGEKLIEKADAISLKSVGLEYDYDNKLFNKTSDIDGKLYNRSNEKTFKNIQLKVVCKNKNGAVVKSFVHTEYITLSPNASHKLRIKFEDAEKTKSANVTVVGAEVILE